MNTKTIYTNKMAYELRKRGFKILEVIPDANKPQFDNYVFEDTEALHKAIDEIMATVYNG